MRVAFLENNVVVAMCWVTEEQHKTLEPGTWAPFEDGLCEMGATYDPATGFFTISPEAKKARQDKETAEALFAIEADIADIDAKIAKLLAQKTELEREKAKKVAG